MKNIHKDCMTILSNYNTTIKLAEYFIKEMEEAQK